MLCIRWTCYEGRWPLCTVLHSSDEPGKLLRPVYNDTTQLHSTSSGVTRRRVELSCIGKVSIATQLNSTSSCRHIHSVNNCHRSVLNVVTQLRVYIATQLKSSWVELHWRSVYSDPPTQLNSTLSWVELRLYKRAFTITLLSWQHRKHCSRVIVIIVIILLVIFCVQHEVWFTVHTVRDVGRVC